MERVNPLLDTDSYKAGHYAYYPEGAREITSYLTARGGPPGYSNVLFFGLQAVLLEHFSDPITEADVEEAAVFFSEHGEPFNRDGWLDIALRGGYLPVEVCALLEGERAAFGEPLVVVRNTRPGFHWLPSYIETKLMRVWYPTTVATYSARLRQLVDNYVALTSDDPSVAPFRVHDFGSRGSTSQESAALGGMAHLVNFLGTDTVVGVVGAQRWYGAGMAGYSVIATEHSTMTTWGEVGEFDAFEAMLDRHARPGAIISVVSDSYDTRRVLTEYLPRLREKIEASGATVVVRLDSGDPVDQVMFALNSLAGTFGSRLNSMGYAVLSPSVRVLQGDGIDDRTVDAILGRMAAERYAIDNVVFGMGGALLQKHNRDTFKFAYKACQLKLEGGEVREVSKRSEDGWKASKTLAQLDTSRLVPVFRDGRLLVSTSFDEVRARAAGGVA